VNSSQIIFAPLLAWPVLAAFGVVCLAAVAPGLAVRARGAAWRAAGFALLFLLLSGPHYVARTLRPLPDVAVLAVDRSQSMAIAGRAGLADAALASLQAQADKIPGLELRVVDVPAADSGGTSLFGAVAPALADVPPAQLAGVVAITDGEIFDPPPAPGFAAPFTALLTAKGEETDRELRIIAAPAYGLVGKSVSLQLEVLDHGVAGTGAPADVTVTEDGGTVWSGAAAIGQPFAVNVPVRHAGPAVVAAQVAALPGEVSLVNDEAAFILNGIARKLEVLLISGNPNQSERSWRLLLKSDPAVELVHFTILRTPDETLDAPPQFVALVPFPVQQLFDTDISKFDLIILDQFNTAGLLPAQYLGNIAAYVKQGGALLVQTGPEFSSADSLALTPLAGVLPAVPAAPGTITQSFAPAVTGLGARHPVTAPFAGMTLAPWDRMETAATDAGDVLMTGGGGGDENWPLLVLAGEGRGRVGMMLSDQFWLWTRGGAHDGPALPLLRRVVHWLLREPALEAEALNASVVDGHLLVQRRTLGANYPGDAAAVRPDGTARRIALKRTGPGRYEADVAAPLPGVWKITEGGMTTYAASMQSNQAEFADLAASAAPLHGLGDIVWLGRTPAPDLAGMIERRHASEVTGTRDVPLLPPLPAMIMAMALLAAAWWRERG
jgi:hypothetical protein